MLSNSMNTFFLFIRLDVRDVVSLPGSFSQGDEQGNGAKEGEKESEKGKNGVTVDEACCIHGQSGVFIGKCSVAGDPVWTQLLKRLYVSSNL